MAAAENLPEDRVLCVTQSHAAAMNLHKRLEFFGVPAARVGTTLTPKEIVEQKIFQDVKERWGADEDEVVFMEDASQVPDYTGMERSKDLQKSQFTVMRRMVMISKVAVLTLASSGNQGLCGMGGFEALVIDEAAQVVEPGPWIPLAWGPKRMILVGDEKQLPATVLHPRARDEGLGISLFERFVKDNIVSHGNGFVQLDEQQRMHPSIAEFPSRCFYDGTLTNGPATATHRPKIPGFPWPSEEVQVAFVECGALKGQEGGRSHENPEEAEALIMVLEHCLRQGLKPSQVGIITGYSAQQELLRRLWSQLAPRLNLQAKELRVDTVDGFQGAERDLILASTVRSFFEVGFMRDPRRVNVMLTRARRGLIVFGNAPTLHTEMNTWKPWIEWMETRRVGVPLETLKEQLDEQLRHQDQWETYVDPDSDRKWQYNKAQWAVRSGLLCRGTAACSSF
ncbi:unnamed protein product [Durusdinium trenchii]|uniref:RNA helicase n=1 Tax=Durusdinium trenchii TaxID=1381693 RepID=A0ABP0QJD2_9DINO